MALSNTFDINYQNLRSYCTNTYLIDFMIFMYLIIFILA